VTVSVSVAFRVLGGDGNSDHERPSGDIALLAEDGRCSGKSVDRWLADGLWRFRQPRRNSAGPAKGRQVAPDLHRGATG